jgi:endoglucanase
VVKTPNLGQSWTIGLLDLLRDKWNLIVDVHYYTPASFTHQGADWVPGASAWRGTRWTAGRGEEAAIERELGFCAEWGRLNERPIYVGEFGAIDQADLESHARWTAFVRRTAEKHGMSLAHWSFIRSPSAVLDERTGGWIEPLKEALAPAN